MFVLQIWNVCKCYFKTTYVANLLFFSSAQRVIEDPSSDFTLNCETTFEGLPLWMVAIMRLDLTYPNIWYDFLFLFLDTCRVVKNSYFLMCFCKMLVIEVHKT